MHFRAQIELMLIVGVICASANMSILADVAFAAPQVGPYQAAREYLVDKVLLPAGIKDPRVLESARQTHRHEFIPRNLRPQAYIDRALPIGAGQTISSPYIVAHMTESLEPQPTDRVLEIGTGSGYQAAILSPLVKDVYSIEIVEALGRQAAKTLKRLGYVNVHTRIGDGYKGWAEHAPFDKIIVTCSPQNVPQPLVDQLAEGGRLVVPLGQRFQQVLYLFTKVDGKLEQEALENTFFVPMTGIAEDRRTVHIDERRPQLVNGGFEEVLESDTSLPTGWFYIRQGEVMQRPDVPNGKRCLTVSNKSPGSVAHAIQPFGVDGQEVSSLTLSLKATGSGLKHGHRKNERAGILIEFYGPTREPLGQVQLDPWDSDFEWQAFRKNIRVPMGARLGIIGVGLFGATGTVSFDDVELRATGPKEDENK